MFTSDDERWGTPQPLFDVLNSEFHFTIDLAALPSNAKCSLYYTPEQNGLLQDWHGVCWLNPPYGRDTNRWLKKAYESSRSGAVIVCLLPARTDTNWFHRWIIGKASIRFIRGRLAFQGFNTTGGARGQAPFGSMIAIYDGKPCITESMKRPEDINSSDTLSLFEF
jgi:phage N-6-adenine-methyltransferase